MQTSSPADHLDTADRTDGPDTLDAGGASVLSVQQTADALGVSVDAVLKRIRRRSLPATKDARGRWQILTADLHPDTDRTPTPDMSSDGIPDTDRTEKSRPGVQSGQASNPGTPAGGRNAALRVQIEEARARRLPRLGRGYRLESAGAAARPAPCRSPSPCRSATAARGGRRGGEGVARARRRYGQAAAALVAMGTEVGRGSAAGEARRRTSGAFPALALRVPTEASTQLTVPCAVELVV